MGYEKMSDIQVSLKRIIDYFVHSHIVKKKGHKKCLFNKYFRQCRLLTARLINIKNTDLYIVRTYIAFAQFPVRCFNLHFHFNNEYF